MKRTIIQTCLLLTLLSGSLKALAGDEKILCPPASTVKQSSNLLDTVTRLFTPKFEVSNKYPKLQDLDNQWTIYTYADAQDMNEALKKAEDTIKNIIAVKDKYASRAGEKLYMCLYTLPESEFVTLFTEKQ